MEYLRDYLREIIGFVLISGFVLNMLPDNKNIKYVKLFTGLVITILLISPVIEIMGTDINDIFDEKTVSEASLQGFEDDLNEKIENEYVEICREYIENIVSDESVSLEKVSCSGDDINIYIHKGSPGKINIGKIIAREEGEDEYMNLKKKISDTLGTNEENIHIYETG